MDWSRPVDLYCERLDATFWSEPVNAISNFAFLIAAAFSFAEWRRAGRRDWLTLVLVALVAVIGAGSFIFHTVATRGAALLDGIPIAIFIYAYLFLAFRRMLGLSILISASALIVYVAVSYAIAMSIPRAMLNGSQSYLPAFFAMLGVAAFVHEPRPYRLLLGAAAVFAVSLTFRTIDIAACDAFPLGTHFLWHVLNGVVLYLLLRAAMLTRKAA